MELLYVFIAGVVVIMLLFSLFDYSVFQDYTPGTAVQRKASRSDTAFQREDYRPEAAFPRQNYGPRRNYRPRQNYRQNGPRQNYGQVDERNHDYKNHEKYILKD